MKATNIYRTITPSVAIGGGIWAQALGIEEVIAQQMNQLVIKTEELQKRFEAQTYAAMDIGNETAAKRETETIDTPITPLATLDRVAKQSRKDESSSKRA